MSRAELTVGAYRNQEGAVVFSPRARPASGTKRGILVCHGYYDDGRSMAGSVSYLTDPSDATGAVAMAGDWGTGYPASAPPAGHVQNGGAATWGNTDSSTALGAGWTYLQSAYGAKTDKVCLFGLSMGGIVALNWANLHPTQVAAIALVIPVLDLSYMVNTAPALGQNGSNVGTSTPGLAADIATSAGGVGNLTAGYYAAHSPIQFAPNLAGIPIKVWEGTDDLVTNQYQDSTARAFCDAVGSSASFVSMGNLGGLGHALGGVTAQDIGAFLGSYV